MKECRFLKREHSRGSKDEKEPNTIATEDDVYVICDDSCISLVRQDSD